MSGQARGWQDVEEKMKGRKEKGTEGKRGEREGSERGAKGVDVLFRNIDEAALVCEVVEAVFVALRAIWSLSRVRQG